MLNSKNSTISLKIVEKVLVLFNSTCSTSSPEVVKIVQTAWDSPTLLTWKEEQKLTLTATLHVVCSFQKRFPSKEETGYVIYFSRKCSILEKNLRISLIPYERFYGVQCLNKSVKSFVIFYQLFQPAQETFFTII